MNLPKTRTHGLALALLALASAGCQLPGGLPTGLAPHLGFERVENAALATSTPQQASAAAFKSTAAAANPAVAPAGDVAPDAAAAQALPTGSGGSYDAGGYAAPLVATHQLTVDLHGFLSTFHSAAPFRLLSTVQDITQVTITVEQGGKTIASATLTQSDINNNQLTKAFDGLPTGNTLVQVIAYDATNTPIGAASQVVALANGAPTTANMAVQIVSGATGACNALTANVTLAAGPAAGTVLSSFKEPTKGLYAGPDGYLYSVFVVAPHGPATDMFIYKYSPTDGKVVADYLASDSTNLVRELANLVYNPITQSLMENGRNSQALLTKNNTGATVVSTAYGTRTMAVDAAGVTYYAAGGKLQAFSNGAYQATNIPSQLSFDIDSQGDFWTSNSDTSVTPAVIAKTLGKYAADGTVLGAFTLPFAANWIKQDGRGGVWVADNWPAATQLIHVASDGTLGTPIPATVDDFCIDTSGNLWVAEGTSLAKILPTGVIAGTYPIAAVTVATNGGAVYAGVDKSDYGTIDVIAP